MKEQIDRDLFRKSIPVLGVKVPPEKAGVLLKADPIKRNILDLPKIKSVIHAPDGQRTVLLRVTSEADLPQEAREYLQAQSAELVNHTIELDYSYWTVEDILDAILPEELLEEAPRGYASIGHIAHLNLNAEYLPYKYVIGQVIVDKIPTIRTVVNKTENIENQFRVFPMELLAGEPNYIVTHRESDCTFTFDFSKVYWNSRLHHEHDRLVKTFKPDDLIADVFAGVGPFAVPAGKRGSAVLANDLNPSSYEFLQKNIEGNKVSHSVRAFCEDGREFIRNSVRYAYDEPFPPYTPAKSRAKQREEDKQRRRLQQQGVPADALPVEPTPSGPPRNRVSQYVMNLPDSALTFLDAFRGLLSPDNLGERDLSGVYNKDKLPMVHCYCFTKELETDKAEADIRQRAEDRLGARLEGDVSFHHVRSVAPNKQMYCVSFRLPAAVAYAS
ncbi:guanine-N-1-methyltransferase [Panus rudis PR-1116 ss-1]|nr:guanine-N-1-methyltransferase [Panus rudis PR-1116 ss-1]